MKVVVVVSQVGSLLMDGQLFCKRVRRSCTMDASASDDSSALFCDSPCPDCMFGVIVGC